MIRLWLISARAPFTPTDKRKRELGRVSQNEDHPSVELLSYTDCSFLCYQDLTYWSWPGGTVGPPSPRPPRKLTLTEIFYLPRMVKLANFETGGPNELEKFVKQKMTLGISIESNAVGM